MVKSADPRQHVARQQAKKVGVGSNRSKNVANVARRDGFYRLTIDGEEQKFVSVTTVLNVINKPALVTWAARTAAGLVLEDPYKFSTPESAASGIYGKRDGAAGRGSTVHSAVEAMLYGAAVDITNMPEELRGYVKGFAQFMRDNDPNPRFIEVGVYNTSHLYAGTTDFLGTLRNRDDELWMLDWKTGKAVYDEAALQTRAYRECDVIMPRYRPCPDCAGDNAARDSCATCFGSLYGVRNTDLQKMPKVDRVGVVLLRPNGSYTMEEPDAPLDAFLAAKRLWEWQRESRKS